jgi:hypothetical protein
MKDQLIKRSTSAGQRAIRHYLSEEYDQFLVQAAASFEQLGKARLAAIHPSLIIDRDFDSFLHVCAAGKHAKRPPWNIRTINATEVLTRCTQLHPGLNDFNSRLRLLADFRNSAIHLGEIIETERKEIFHTFLASTSLVVDEMGIRREEFFGEFADLVAAHLDKSLAEVNRVVAENIARAKTNYHQKFGSLDSVHVESIVKSVESRYSPSKYEEILVKCPACDKQGLVTGSFDVEWEADYDDDGSAVAGYPVVTLAPSSFICNLCGLTLADTSELKAAGLGEPIGIEDVDPSDFYPESDS